MDRPPKSEALITESMKLRCEEKVLTDDGEKEQTLEDLTRKQWLTEIWTPGHSVLPPVSGADV